jgi:hypothetical protein
MEESVTVVTLSIGGENVRAELTAILLIGDPTFCAMFVGVIKEIMPGAVS